MGTSFKKFPAYTAALSDPSPGSRPPSTHPSTRDSWTLMGKSGSVSCGSLFLSSGSWCAQGLFVPPKSLFPQSCVSSGRVGLMVTSSKRAYVIPRSATPRVHAPVAGHCRPVPLQETLKHFWLSLCGVSGSWCTQGLFEPSEHLWWVRGLILNVISPLLPCRWSFSFALDVGYLFLVESNSLQSMVVHQWVVVLEFSQERMCSTWGYFFTLFTNHLFPSKLFAN